MFVSAPPVLSGSAPIPDNKCGKCKDSAASGQAHNIHNDESVFSSRWIVVIAVEQDGVDQRADLVLTGFDKTQPEIAGREFQAIKVLGETSFRREDHDRAHVRPLTGMF